MTGDYNDATQQQTLDTSGRFDDECEAVPGKDAGRRGASMVEYALLLVFVLLAAFLSLKFFGESVVAVFEASADTVENAPNVKSGS